MNTTTNTGATVMTFKSERAAKVAMTKAEKAYNAASVAYSNARNQPVCDGYEAEDAAKAACVAAADFAQSVYDAARAQGFWVHSYRFGYNPTRDLILANID